MDSDDFRATLGILLILSSGKIDAWLLRYKLLQKNCSNPLTIPSGFFSSLKSFLRCMLYNLAFSPQDDLGLNPLNSHS